MAKAKRKPERIDVPEEMLKRIHAMADRTFQAIGFDLFSAYADDGGDGEIPRDEIVECVGDADRMAMYGRDKEAYEFYKSIPTWEQKEEVLTGAFPFEIYSL